MARRHDREEILNAAVDVVAQAGLTGLTFRRVADRLGIPDRTVVYYFPSKDRLLAAVLQAYAGQLQQALSHALQGQRLPPRQVLERAWSALQTGEADTAFRVFLEVAGLAAAGQLPYRDLSAALARDWTAWLAEHLTGPADSRRQAAAALLAQLDGLLLLRHTGDPDLAHAAARGLQLTGTEDRNPTHHPAGP